MVLAADVPRNIAVKVLEEVAYWAMVPIAMDQVEENLL